MGQWQCHGWTHMNHSATVSQLSFASLIQGATEVSERVLGCLWGLSSLWVKKRLECQMSRRTLQMPHRTTGNCKGTLWKAEASLLLL